MTLRRWIFVVLTLALWTPGLAVSAAESCKTRRAEADRELWLNERDRALASEAVFPWGAPVESASAENQRRLVQRDYVIEHDDDLLGPLWAANVVGVKRLRGGRCEYFRADPRIPSVAAARPADYDDPIFDQGHMVPNADMTFATVPILNTYMMSNMSPQFCQFNRGIWQMFEGLVRHWSRAGPIYILNGAVFDHDKDGARDRDGDSIRMRSRSGRTRVGVPSAYFKILARRTDMDQLETLTILLPHNQAYIPVDDALPYLSAHVSSLTEVERLTGTDFFPAYQQPIAERGTLWPADDARMTTLTADCGRTDGAIISETSAGLPRVYELRAL